MGPVSASKNTSGTQYGPPSPILPRVIRIGACVTATDLEHWPIATGGHIPTLPRRQWVVGLGTMKFAEIWRDFGGGRGGKGYRPKFKFMVSLSTVLFHQCSILLGKCVFQLLSVYLNLDSGDFDPDLHWGFWTHRGTSVPYHFAHPTPEMAMPLTLNCLSVWIHQSK